MHQTDDPGCLAAVAVVFAAMSHPSRLAILHALAEHSHTVGEIAAHVHLTQPMTSQHLATLQRVGVVVGRRSANRVTYAIADRAIVELLDFAAAFQSRVKRGSV